MVGAVVKPWIRASIVVVSIVALGLIAWLTTGSPVPTEPEDALLLQNGLLLVVLGSTLLEPYFTRPAEALVNSLTAFVTLIAVFPSAPRQPWTLVVAFLGIVLISSIVCIALQGRPDLGRYGRATAAVSYRVSSTLGRARIVFSVVFLAAVAFFIDSATTMTLSLVAFWAFFIAIWPLGLPQFLSSLTRTTENSADVVGSVNRIDSPGIVRVELTTADRWRWKTSPPLLVHMQDRSVRWGVPLLSEDRSDGRWGTLMLAGDAQGCEPREPGTVERPSATTATPEAEDLLRLATGIHEPHLIGFVKEGSTIMELRIEALPDSDLRLGQMVVIPTPSGPVYYQIMQGLTHEELFGGLNYGSQVITANQVGRVDGDASFSRYAWLPSMNAPAFLVSGSRDQLQEATPGLFTLGQVPGSALTLSGDFLNNLESHTAILGVTGSGKTEFAFDLIRHAVGGGVKVVCIDLTSQYIDRLADLHPRELSISDELAKTLGTKLFDVETGKYGATDEKKELEKFAIPVRDDVETRLRDFLESDTGLGLIELREISNTKATLWITETYMSALLRLARDETLADQRVLVVVEEAHTVMPEPSFLGLGDYDSKGTVAKITQIALQGRKYGVGLLVLAQRTATVSKSVLTQCNTVISFSCIDDTSIGFLRNVFGSTVAESLPSLPRLTAVAHGTWINSDGPITFEVPFDTQKARLSFRRPGRKNPAVPGDQAPPAPLADAPPF